MRLPPSANPLPPAGEGFVAKGDRQTRQRERAIATPNTPQPPRPHLHIALGLATDQGARPTNDDAATAWLPDPGRTPALAIATIADGVGSAKGGRVAAETATHTLIDGILGQSEALPIRRTAATAIAAANRWIHAIGRTDPALAGMACTLTAAILRGHRLHVLHVGDTRLYRLRGDTLDLLTDDHVQHAHGLLRAVGAEPEIRVDYAEHQARAHDRLLLASDGVHGALSRRQIAAELGRREAPETTARRLVAAAIAARLGDNATALVLDLLELPPPDQADLAAALDARPIRPPPKPGASIDGLRVERVIADARYSRVLLARDPAGQPVVLKFPKPGAADEALFRQAYLREAWIAARIRSPFVGTMLDPPSAATQLYAAMPYYGPETLERRLLRPPPVRLDEGVAIATGLAKAVAALHRAGIVHRDIKPDNVVLTPAGPRLIDLGVARLPHLEDNAASDNPGTASYMAPQLFDGAPGDEAADLFALGVTLWRMWSGGAYPYGEIEPFSRPRFGALASLARRRPDLPAWLDQTLARAVALDPGDRPADALELALLLETGLAAGAPTKPPERSLYERNPVRFWQTAALLLALALLLTWTTR